MTKSYTKVLYSEISLERPLVLKDQHIILRQVLYVKLNVNEPVTKDHLS